MYSGFFGTLARLKGDGLLERPCSWKSAVLVQPIQFRGRGRAGAADYSKRRGKTSVHESRIPSGLSEAQAHADDREEPSDHRDRYRLHGDGRGRLAIPVVASFSTGRQTKRLREPYGILANGFSVAVDQGNVQSKRRL